MLAPDAPGASALAEGEGPEVDEGHVSGQRQVIAVAEILDGGDGLDGPSRHDRLDPDEGLRVRAARNGPEEGALHPAEGDRGAGEADGKRTDGEEREAGRVPERSERVPEVLESRIHVPCRSGQSGGRAGSLCFSDFRRGGRPLADFDVRNWTHSIAPGARSTAAAWRRQRWRRRSRSQGRGRCAATRSRWRGERRSHRGGAG